MPKNPNTDWRITPDPSRKEEMWVFMLSSLLHDVKMSNQMLLKIMRAATGMSQEEARKWYHDTSDTIMAEIGLTFAEFGDVTIPKDSPLSGDYKKRSDPPEKE